MLIDRVRDSFIWYTIIVIVKFDIGTIKYVSFDGMVKLWLQESCVALHTEHMSALL